MDYYWEITPKQFIKHVKADEKKRELRIKENDLLNHVLGKYIAHSVNKPGTYPKEPYLKDLGKEQEKMMTAEEMDRMMRYNTIKLGGKIKK